MKKFFALALALLLALSLTVASADELKVIRVGATAAPHAEILESEAVTAKLAELGYKLEVVVYEGYVLENPAVADGMTMRTISSTSPTSTPTTKPLPRANSLCPRSPCITSPSPSTPRK